MASDRPTYLDEIGPSLIIFVGIVLVLIPEPATSTLGAGLVLFGLAYLFWEWRRP